MKKMFNYTKFNSELDNIVESGIALAEAFAAGKESTAEYKEANKAFNEAFMKECVEAMPNTKFESLEMIKNPMVHNDVFFQRRFDVILAQVMTPVIPKLISNAYDNIYDVTQVGYGDNAKYTVRSNELFIVNDQAQGISRGGVQTAYDTEYTVSAKKTEVACYVDWYHVAAGKQDWGYIVSKTAYAYAMYIEGMVATKLAQCIKRNDGTTGTNVDGIAGYIANGFSDQNWINISRYVSLANGGAQTYAFGSEIALANVVPDLTTLAPGKVTPAAQLMLGEDSSYIKDGYLPAYKKVPMIEMHDALLPNTINGQPKTILDDKIIYMIPAGMYKPVKVVFEGGNVSVTKDPSQMADHTYTFQINMMVGVDVVVGAKFGAIEL